ncbi:Mediator of RNA polymerase II transcription subunit 17 [Rhynchospora pubera]|uniref:Mediator of RNA polymerase II transcription subunit 17 n=1 Tax=Rhynchospora pubera TaxID=906938 RepID=A0AAV8CFT0_9POAL|nr:Mediator of RNA polymerase II transcription subunit 17 [Rhynchospora pubera]
MEVERNKRMRIDVDKLPMKRLLAIDEIGNEQFPPEKSNEEQRLSAIHRIDFSLVVEKEKEKEKEEKDKELSKSKDGQQQQQPWQGLMENLRQAQHELSVILDLISTVEANDSVAVALMQRPKPLPNEALADFAVSAATKVQRLRHLGRYFKQCSKTMEQQVSKEARFYGSLIRLQQNWKVKRQRMGISEGFTFDLFDSRSLSGADSSVLTRPSPMSTIIIDQDAFGMLAIQLPQKSCRTLCLKFLGDDSSTCRIKNNTSEKNASSSGSDIAQPPSVKEILSDEDVSGCIGTTHSILRDIHRSLFEEKVFEMVNREAFNNQSSQGINVTGMRQDFLQLVIGQDSSLCLSLVLSEPEGEYKENGKDGSYNEDSSESGSSSALAPILLPTDDKNPTRSFSKPALSSKLVLSLQIYLLSIFHQETLSRAKEGHSSCGYLLAHFCMSVAHRVFSNKVLSILENLVSRVSYVELVSHPTWHSRTSSWSLRLKVPEASSVFDGGYQKQTKRSQFLTKVVIKDGQISLRGQSSATIVASFTGDATEPHSINTYTCDLEDLPMLILHQVASQVIQWLHEEALVVGMKTSRDLLCLNVDLEQGDTLSLMARVDPDDASACISWALAIPAVTDDAVNFSFYQTDSDNPGLKFLGSLSLESLYSALMDLANFCGNGAVC